MQELPIEKSNEADEKKTWISPKIEHWEYIHLELTAGGGADGGHSAYV